MKALITGASSGIGRDMARVLAKKGYNLVLVARDEQKLNELAEELRKENKIEIQVISMDLSIEQNCKDLHKSVKDVDILINNAGFGDCGNFTHTDLNKELTMIKTNIIAYHILTKLYLVDMKAKNSGKILNVEKASIDKVLANAEIKTMINAFGCGFSEGYGNDFDISKLRYDKIIIMADADVDGAHISTLLLTLFYRFMPELIYEGHVYIAMPPLYKAMPTKGEEEYLYDDAALARYRKTHKGSFTLQRYKGLGEMDAQQLWETTLNPETRMLKQVEIEDARMASDVTEMLMGTDVPPRRKFIYDNAKDAELDI